MPRWRRYAGAAAGAVLGLVTTEQPWTGAVYGYQVGKWSERNLPKNIKMPRTPRTQRTRRRTNPYPSPRYSGSRSRTLPPRYGGSKRVPANMSTGKRKLSSGSSTYSGRRDRLGRPYVTVGAAARRGSVRKSMKRGRKPLFTPGPYTGNFRKPVRVKRTAESKALSQGYHLTVEQHGVVSDSDTVFITHSTLYINRMADAIMAALIRKIMTKAGFKMTNVYNEVAASTPSGGTSTIPSIQPAENSGGLKFIYTEKEMTNGIYQQWQWESTDNLNFNGFLAGMTHFRNRLIEFMRNTSPTGTVGSPAVEPYKIAVYKQDQSGADVFWRLGAEMYLEDVHLELDIQSHLTIQNRTAAAYHLAGTTGDHLDADRVDNQPLKGWIYEFKHADPRLRHTGNQNNGTLLNNAGFNRIPDTGLALGRGANFDGSREPFVPQYFSNISKATRVVLQPGEMKKLSFYHKFSGKFNSVYKKLRVTRWDLTTTVSGAQGKSQMVCFEEMIRTVSTNKINIGYEREYKVGAIVKYSLSQAPLESYLTSEEYNAI